MPKRQPSAARVFAATTAKDQIAAGSPEEAYQAVNLAKMLWGFRLRDVDAWREVIERWATDPPAWERIPDDDEPYGSPRRMIAAELDVDYDQFKEFIRIVLGVRTAALIDERPAEHGGNRNPQGHNQYSNNGQVYVHKLDQTQARGGTSQEYLRQRILKEYPEALDEIGKDGKYKTVTEAARKLGINTERPRLHISADDPAAAGRYLAQRVDRSWLQAMIDAYDEAHDGNRDT